MNKAKKTKEVKQITKILKKATPFADTGSIIGGALGGMFQNRKMGTGIGRFLGSGIGSIFGSGDYELNGARPSYNVLTNDNQIPKFDTTKQTNIVCHREYLGDIIGTTGFNLTNYPLNPGMGQTFPWLATIASNYQEYRFHGLIFEFRSLITDFVTNGAPGVVVMATNYNADVPLYTTKQQMENSEYAASVKPTLNMIHGIECATSQTINPIKYVRTAAVPLGQDLRLYDGGNFQFATQANPSGSPDLGELWVSYCVEFMKPILPPDVTGGDILSAHVKRSTVTPTNPMGSIGVSITSNYTNFTVTPTSFSFLASPQTQYLCVLSWYGTVAGVSLTAPFITPNNATLPFYWNNNTFNNAAAPNNGTSATQQSINLVLLSTALNPSVIGCTLGTAGTYPTGTTNFDLIITQLDSTLTT